MDGLWYNSHGEVYVETVRRRRDVKGLKKSCSTCRLVDLIDLKGIAEKAGQLVNLNGAAELDEDVKLVDL